MAEETGSVETGNPVEADAPAEATSATSGTALHEGPSEHWMAGVQDPSTKAWAEAKGLQNGSFENVLGSYRNLEKLMGADKAGRTVTLLGDDATPEQRADFDNKLGRPKEASEYTAQLPEGVTDDTRMVMMRDKAHEIGITDAQFSALAEADMAYISQSAQAQDDYAVMSAADASAELKREWGAAYDMKVAGVDLAAQNLGFSDDHLNALRVALGPVEAMKFVDGLSSKMGDDTFDSGASIIPNHKTPEQAKEELGELTMNKEFMDAWLDRTHPGHTAAMDKKSKLARLAAGVV